MKPKISIRQHVSMVTIILGVFIIVFIFLGTVFNMAGFISFRSVNSDNPQDILDGFLVSLMNGNLDYAKKLLVAEQRDHFDEWISGTIIDPFKCPIDWRLGLDAFIEPTAGGVGGSKRIDDTHSYVDQSWHCYNTGSSLTINNAMLVFNGKQWKIADWGEVCYSPAEEDVPETCYP
jgi:hypothetical protein